jgi:hypothetical protein
MPIVVAVVREALLSGNRSDGSLERARDAHLVVSLELWDADDHIRLEHITVNRIDVPSFRVKGHRLAWGVVTYSEINAGVSQIKLVEEAQWTQVHLYGGNIPRVML